MVENMQFILENNNRKQRGCGVYWSSRAFPHGVSVAPPEGVGRGVEV